MSRLFDSRAPHLGRPFFYELMRFAESRASIKFTFVCGEIDGTRRDPLGVASPQQDDEVSSELYLQIQTFPLGVSATMLM